MNHVDQVPRPARPDGPNLACVLRHAPDLLELLVRQRFPYQDAEDAVQVALIRGVQLLQTGRVHELKDLQAWLRTVAIHAARTIARRRKWLTLSDSVGPTVTPFDEMERREEERVRMAAVLEAIGELPDELRLPIVYCMVAGNTVRDAARTFGLPVSTVSCRLSKARRQLRADLRSQGFDIPKEPKKRERVARRASARVLKVDAAQNSEGRDQHGYDLSKVPQH